MNDQQPLPTTLGLNGHSYVLAEVLRLAVFGPKIRVQTHQINGSLSQEITAHERSLPPSDQRPVFYQYEGKYLVLANFHSYELQRDNPDNDGEIEGRLISGPMLKKARADQRFEENRLVTPPAPWRVNARDDDQFANRPRVTYRPRPVDRYQRDPNPTR